MKEHELKKALHETGDPYSHPDETQKFDVVVVLGGILYPITDIDWNYVTKQTILFSHPRGSADD